MTAGPVAVPVMDSLLAGPSQSVFSLLLHEQLPGLVSDTNRDLLIIPFTGSQSQRHYGATIGRRLNGYYGMKRGLYCKNIFDTIEPGRTLSLYFRKYESVSRIFGAGIVTGKYESDVIARHSWGTDSKPGKQGLTWPLIYNLLNMGHLVEPISTAQFTGHSWNKNGFVCRHTLLRHNGDHFVEHDMLYETLITALEDGTA